MSIFEDEKRSEGRKNQGKPMWFLKPAPRGDFQTTLFPENVYDVLARTKVSPDELARWHQSGWISFDSNSAHSLEPVHVDEIIFVRDVVRSGLPDAYLRILLDQLPKPLAVDPDRIVFSFTHGWVIPAFTREPDLSEYMEENVDAWLDQLAEEGEIDRLVEIKDRIGELLSQNDGAGVEESEA